MIGFFWPEDALKSARLPQLDRGFDDFRVSGRKEGIKTPMIPRVF